jgi:GNAT superfamily N-acetyltransferase
MILEVSIEDACLKFAKNESEKRLIAFPFKFKRTHFVCEIEGRAVGRISANLSERDPRRGYVGMFEMDLSLKDSERHAKALIQAAEQWLLTMGVEEVYGPVNYSTLFQYRFELPRSVSGSNEPVFFWEPSQPPEYLNWFLGAHFELADEYHSRAFAELHQILPKSEGRFQAALASGFSTRVIDMKGTPERELRALAKINRGSFEESFLAEPFDEKAYVALIVPQFNTYLSEFSFFILNPAGEEIGYFFLFPEHDYLVWKTLAILPEYQGAGLASFGIHHALSLAQKHNISKVVSALIRKGAGSEQLLKRGEEYLIWEHRYGVFKKRINP